MQEEKEMIGKKKTSKKLTLNRKRGAVLVVKRGTISDERYLAKMNKQQLLEIAVSIPDVFDRFGNPSKGKLARRFLKTIYGMSVNDIDKYVNEKKREKMNKVDFIKDVKRYYKGEISESVLVSKWGISIEEIESKYKSKIFESPTVPIMSRTGKQLYHYPTYSLGKHVTDKDIESDIKVQPILYDLDEIIIETNKERKDSLKVLFREKYHVSTEVLDNFLHERLKERKLHSFGRSPTPVPFMKTPTGQRSFSIWGYGLFNQYIKLPPEKRKEFLLSVVDRRPEFSIHIAHILSGGSPYDEFEVAQQSYKVNKDILKKEMQDYLLKKRIHQLKQPDDIKVEKKVLPYSSILESYRSGEYAHKTDLTDTSFLDKEGLRRNKHKKPSIKRKSRKIKKTKKVVKRCRCK